MTTKILQPALSALIIASTLSPNAWALEKVTLVLDW